MWRSYAFVVLVFLLSNLSVHAAVLKPETLAAWEAYIQGMSTQAPASVHLNQQFLKSTGDTDMLGRLQQGELVVVPVGQTPRKVPGGLIHHWMGTVFIAGSSMDPVLSVIRDYTHYRDYYHPGVIASNCLPAMDRATVLTWS